MLTNRNKQRDFDYERIRIKGNLVKSRKNKMKKQKKKNSQWRELSFQKEKSVTNNIYSKKLIVLIIK